MSVVVSFGGTEISLDGIGVVLVWAPVLRSYQTLVGVCFMSSCFAKVIGVQGFPSGGPQ